jgi:hypothetical protein
LVRPFVILGEEAYASSLFFYFTEWRLTMYPEKARNLMYHNLVDPTEAMILKLMELDRLIKEMEHESGGDMSAIQEAIDTLKTDLSDLSSNLTEVSEALGTKANASTLSTLSNTVKGITDTEIPALETAIGGKADKTALDGKADKTALDNKADKTALTSVGDRVTAVEDHEILNRLTIVDNKLQLDGQDVVPPATDGGTA